MSDTSSEAPFPWPPASASGVGSLPGADPAEAMRLIFGELPDLPHLAELPGRGPGADLVGRTAGLLVELPVETVPGGWRFAARPGKDLIRARGMLSSDLDAMEEVASGYRGPLKIQVCGPWTLAASIELARSQDPALADPGALADLTASLAEGVAGHVAEVRKRVPGAQVLVQVDEPGLPAVLAGAVPSASGLNRMPARPAAEAEAGLRAVLSAASAYTIVHCCALSAPFGMIRGAGADAVSFDLSQLRTRAQDELAEAVEAGMGILAGVVPALPVPPGPAGAGRRGGGASGGSPGGGPSGGPHGGAADSGSRGQPAGNGSRGGRPGAGQAPDGRNGGRSPSTRAVAGRVIEVWRQMGWPGPRREGMAAGSAGMAAQVVLTPACGLAGATPAYARAALASCRDAARALPELIEESR